MGGAVINMTLLRDLEESTGCSSTTFDDRYDYFTYTPRYDYIREFVFVEDGCQGVFQICYNTPGK